MITYHARFEPDRTRGGFVVTFPDFGYGVTQAETVDEGIDLAEDLLKRLAQESIRGSEILPAPGKHRGRHFRPISLSALASAKVELYCAFRASGLKKAEFARNIGIAKTNLERLFDLDHGSRLDQIEAAFHALGKRLNIVVDNAA
jgi:antitoxin HicB